MTRPILQYRLSHNVAEAEVLLRKALQEEGFGILTEVDVAAVMRQRLGIEMPPHKVLGACNPQIAHASITAQPDVAAFLPCGIANREGADPEQTIITLQNPQMISEAFDEPALAGPSDEAMTRLQAALARIGTVA